MIKKISYKKVVPYIVAIVLFVVLSVIYFSPALEGKKLAQDDITRFKGMSKEIVDFREETGEETLWTNNMFSGMPAYMTSVKYKGNLITYIHKILQLGLPHPANYLFLYLLGFFILLLAMRVNPWLSLIGAIAFSFSSYLFIIIEAGHNTKAVAIAYMAPVLAGIILTYRGKYLIGGILTALFLALELRANHLQITYYLFIIILIYGIFELAGTIRQKKYVHFLKSTAILVVAVLLAVLTHITSLWIAYDHAKYTTRGKSELTFDEVNRTTGLDKDYVTAWSYGITETFTLLVPDFMGGSSSGGLDEKSAVYNELIQIGAPRAQARQIAKQMPVYWGPQPFTSGPVYVGSIVFFLFIFGLFVVKGKLKWWLLTATILSIMLAWGRHFMVFTDFFLDYIPGYNKFRAVSMTLVIAELAMPVLGFLALNQILKEGIDKEKVIKSLKYAFYIVGGLLLLFILFPGVLFDFSAQVDAQLPNWMDELIDKLRDDRKSIMRMDAVRSFVFIALAAIILWAMISKKLKTTYGYLLLGLFIISDMWMIDKRYLNNDNFMRRSKIENPYKPSVADKYILRDKDPDFRVLNLSLSTFNDASTSYFHKSIGGYHGAKLGRYQELIEYQINPEIEKMKQAFSGSVNMEIIYNTLAVMPVLNMLNTRYIIFNPQSDPIGNPFALGNAWFVDEYEVIENANQEIMALSDFDPSGTAIIDKRFKNYLDGFMFEHDSLARIEFVSYQPNHLVYRTNAISGQLAIFSEIYYKKGWNAYVDGQLTPHFRADYVLRAMIVPAGEHTIDFRFEPVIYSRGEKISLASSILLILLVLAGGFFEIRKALKKQS